MDARSFLPVPACIIGGPTPFFKNRDRNKDGAITLEEFIGNPKGRNVPALTKRFKHFDADGDGKLMLEEVKKAEK